MNAIYSCNINNMKIILILILSLSGCAADPYKFQTESGCKAGNGIDNPMECPPAEVEEGCEQIAPDMLWCKPVKSANKQASN
jgi:hypothetical protein